MPRPILIAHRGASGSRPEHTLGAYALAIEQGADFIEPDLVLTRDGVLVARHENEISGTTDIASRPAFAHLRRTQLIDGTPVTGWFTEDLTLAELATLRARERLPDLRPANTAFDGAEGVPTLDAVLDLLDAHHAATGRRIGIYPETKHPAHFAAIGLPHAPPLAAALAARGLDRRDAAVFIQSFEVGNLGAWRARASDGAGARLVQLMDAAGGPADRSDLSYAAMATPAGLAAIARYADAIGVAKAMILPDGPDAPPTRLIADAHAAGLAVHVWTVRRENAFLHPRCRIGADPAAPGDVAAEVRALVAAGVDGLFTDHLPETIAAVG